MDPALEAGLFTMAGAALGPFLTGMLGFTAWTVVSRRKLDGALLMLETELKGNLEQVKVAMMALDSTGEAEVPELSRGLFDAFGTELLDLPPTVRQGIVAGYAHAFAPRVLERRVPNRPPRGSVIVNDALRATNHAITLIELELALPPWPLRPIVRWIRNR